jgi:phage shock protein PspC (stress-responsive transcriptional regulator)
MATQIHEHRLHRSRKDRMLFGVCGGLAEYFEIDPVLVRVIFVLLVLSGAGLLAYIILAIVMPDEEATEAAGRERMRQNLESLRTEAGEIAQDLRVTASPAETDAEASARHRRHQEIAGLVLVGLGLLIVIGNLGWMRWWHWGTFWPVILVLIGVAILFGRGRFTGRQ